MGSDGECSVLPVPPCLKGKDREGTTRPGVKGRRAPLGWHTSLVDLDPPRETGLRSRRTARRGVALVHTPAPGPGPGRLLSSGTRPRQKLRSDFGRDTSQPHGRRWTCTFEKGNRRVSYLGVPAVLWGRPESTCLSPPVGSDSSDCVCRPGSGRVSPVLPSTCQSPSRSVCPTTTSGGSPGNPPRSPDSAHEGRSRHHPASRLRTPTVERRRVRHRPPWQELPYRPPVVRRDSDPLTRE